MSETTVVIVGAGPYGLSIAAHLHKRNIDLRIFGSPMSSWRNHMPAGMCLKSEGFASNLYDPDGSFPLARYCQEQGIPYADVGLPTAVETFSAYGLEFQKRFVPELEETDIRQIEHAPEGFLLTTARGDTLRARRVIIAAGITHFSYLPPVLSGMPKELVTHSSQHREVDSFRDRRVAIIGAGSSAVDLAGLMEEAGTAVNVVTRRKAIEFCGPPPESRTLVEKMLRPRSTLGSGWPSRLAVSAPLVFHAMPKGFRLPVVKRHLGPAPTWFSKSKFVDRVTVHNQASIEQVSPSENGVCLKLSQNGAGSRELQVDHVIAATGYKVSLQRLPFLHDMLRRQINNVEDTPVLNTCFETSVPGLYMVGLASANSFGPLCRFACGAEFTAKRLSRHLASLQ